MEINNLGIEHSFKEADDVYFIEINTILDTVNIVPFYLRGNNWTNDLEKMKHFFLEKELDKQVVIGDMNARIGNTQQNIEDIFRETFTTGYHQRKSEDQIINANGRKFFEFCNDNGLIILNGQTKGDKDGHLTFNITISQ